MWLVHLLVLLFCGFVLGFWWLVLEISEGSVLVTFVIVLMGSPFWDHFDMVYLWGLVWVGFSRCICWWYIWCSVFICNSKFCLIRKGTFWAIFFVNPNAQKYILTFSFFFQIPTEGIYPTPLSCRKVKIGFLYFRALRFAKKSVLGLHKIIPFSFLDLNTFV